MLEENIMLEIVVWFVIGFGFGFIAAGCFVWFLNWRSTRKFQKFLRRLKETVDEKVRQKDNREVSELSFRDKDGVMNTVRIVIDHDMDRTLTDEDKEKVKSVLEGHPDPDMQAGSMADLLSGHKIEESAMENVHEFVFSAKAVEDMRQYGMEPDEVVTRMLKASGRMME